MPGNKYPSLDEIKNSRLAAISQKIGNSKEPDRYARAYLEERKTLEFPNAITDPNATDTSRSIAAFYADGKKAEVSDKHESMAIQFTALFKQYGTPKYVAEIVEKLTKQLSTADQKLIIQNSAFLHKQIKDNLGENTTVDYFINFVKNIIEKRAEKLGETTRNNNARNELIKLLDAARKEGHAMEYDGVKVKFVKPAGVRNLAAGLSDRAKAMNEKIKGIIDRNPTNGAAIVHGIIDPYMGAGAVGGAGFTSKRLKKKMKKFIHRPKNLKVIRGGGAVILNPQEKVSHKVFTKDKTFYELNKYIIDADQLKNNVCDIRYALNGKKVRSFKCENGMKDMIIDLCNETFSLSKYAKLKQDDKNSFLKFCENAHVDVGMSNSIADAETQYKVYEGELDAGNPAPMMMFLFDSFSKGKLSKPDYLNSLNEIYKSK